MAGWARTGPAQMIKKHIDASGVVDMGTFRGVKDEKPSLLILPHRHEFAKVEMREPRNRLSAAGPLALDAKSKTRYRTHPPNGKRGFAVPIVEWRNHFPVAEVVRLRLSTQSRSLTTSATGKRHCATRLN